MLTFLNSAMGGFQGEDDRVSAVDDLDEVIEQCQLALGEFVKGNPEPMQRMFSHREDATLANPIAPPARGWDQVAATMERAASNLSDGEITDFETISKCVTSELAYVVWIERQKGKVGGRQEAARFDLRVTMVFRPEGGTWKVVHRHADTTTTVRPAESMIQQ